MPHLWRLPMGREGLQVCTQDALRVKSNTSKVELRKISSGASLFRKPSEISDNLQSEELQLQFKFTGRRPFVRTSETLYIPSVLA